MEDMTNTTVETQETEGKSIGAAVVVGTIMLAGAGAGKLVEKGAKKVWNSKPVKALRDKRADKKSEGEKTEAVKEPEQ